MKDVSIEYAHIYTNNDIDREHELSVSILDKKIKDNLKNMDVSLVTLVDDYSFPDPTFNYDVFLDWLSDKGYVPDICIRESQLIPECDKLIELLDDGKLKDKILNYIFSKNKYPCSLFIAAWYLVRLGKLESDIFNPEYAAKSLVNILPESFRPFEDRAVDLISVTKYKDVVENIKNQYFDGRLVF